MHRNRWFLLLNEKPPVGKNLDKGVKIFCNAIKQDAVIAVNKNRFDYAACKKSHSPVHQERLHATGVDALHRVVA